jgi:hypothetical protein
VWVWVEMCTSRGGLRLWVVHQLTRLDGRHRLNEMERREFDLAKKMGFVQLRGTGYR